MDTLCPIAKRHRQSFSGRFLSKWKEDSFAASRKGLPTPGSHGSQRGVPHLAALLRNGTEPAQALVPETAMAEISALRAPDFCIGRSRGGCERSRWRPHGAGVRDT